MREKGLDVKKIDFNFKITNLFHNTVFQRLFYSTKCFHLDRKPVNHSCINLQPCEKKRDPSTLKNALIRRAGLVFKRNPDRFLKKNYRRHSCRREYRTGNQLYTQNMDCLLSGLNQFPTYSKNYSRIWWAFPDQIAIKGTSY